MAKKGKQSRAHDDLRNKKETQRKRNSTVSTRLRDFRCGEPYHVYQRGNHGKKTFLDPMARFHYLERLFLLARRHSVRVHNFCLMHNHVHFVMEQQFVDGISNLMQELQPYHARFHNQRLHKTGNLWQQHFGCKHIDTNEYYLTVMKYVETNPARCRRQTQPTEFVWSGARAHVAGEQVEIALAGKVLKTELYLEGWRERCKEAIAHGWLKILLGRCLDSDSLAKIEAMLDGKKRQAMAQTERAKRRKAEKDTNRPKDEAANTSQPFDLKRVIADPPEEVLLGALKKLEKGKRRPASKAQSSEKERVQKAARSTLQVRRTTGAG